MLIVGFALQALGLMFQQLEMFVMVDNVWEGLTELRQELVQNEVLKP